MNALTQCKDKIAIVAFFALYLFVGLSIFSDYGMSWDEGAWRGTGIIVARYVAEGNPELLTYQDRYNGPVFQVLLVGIERLLNLTGDTRAVFLMRHLVNFLFFFVGVFIFYRLCRYRFRSWKVGLLGSSFLVLSPRIFAHSFYNSSDIALLVLFVISIYTLVIYLREKTVKAAILHAVASALVVDIRLMGLMVPFFTAVFLMMDFIVGKKGERSGWEIGMSFLIYLILLAFLAVLFWPTLWRDPVGQFKEALGYVTEVPWGGTVLYLGDYVKDSRLPWHYTPVWIAISTPILYIPCFLLGCFFILVRFLKKPARYFKVHRYDFIILLWFFLPLCVMIGLRPGLYDGWRHMFFIYPAFLILALLGITSLYDWMRFKFKGLSQTFLRVMVILIVGWSFITTGHAMAKDHPYQNVYFNRLAGKDMKEIKKRFELDYWGLSYREALEYVLENDRGPVIDVFVANQPGKENAKILTSRERVRLNFVDRPEDAAYFLSNYRWHKEDYPYDDEFYSIEIDGAKIMVVYRLKNQIPEIMEPFTSNQQPATSNR